MDKLIAVVVKAKFLFILLKATGISLLSGVAVGYAIFSYATESATLIGKMFTETREYVHSYNMHEINMFNMLTVGNILLFVAIFLAVKKFSHKESAQHLHGTMPRLHMAGDICPDCAKGILKPQESPEQENLSYAAQAQSPLVLECVHCKHTFRGPSGVM